MSCARQVLLLTLSLSIAPSIHAKITTPVTLEQVVKDQPLIFTATVTEFLPDKPGFVFTPNDKLRGEFAFDRVPVNLTGDAESMKEKQTALLLERLDKDVPLIVFAARRGKTYNAFAYSNGTWIGMTGTVETQDGKEVTRWRFTHCEPYFRRTFKGTTEELLKAVQGGIKGEKLPAYNEKEEPGYGPPLKKDKPPGKEPLLPLGVIQLPFLGLIAALAALFPAVFGGAALMMRRWVVALSIASFISILAAVALYFPNWIAWTGLRSISSVWLTGAVIAGLGALWAVRRYRRAIHDGKVDEFQPRYLDRIGLGVVLVLLAGGLGYAILANEPLNDSPWLELLLLTVPTVACLYYVLTHWLRTRASARPVAVSVETVGLWAGTFACAVAGVALMGGPRGPAIVQGGSGGMRLSDQPIWVFEPRDKGEILSTPFVTADRVFVAVHHRQGFSQYGRVYALDVQTGAEVWAFDDSENLKPTFSSPVVAEGKLFIGEGYHTDHDSKLFCVDATTGKKIWEFPTTSHTESSPAVAGGRVVVGAGDDGMYCLDAATGQKLWQYPVGGGLHIDSNPQIADGRVFAGSGMSQKSKTTSIFCVDLKTGQEVWSEKVDYSAWGSPTVAGQQVLFATGNGTLSEDRTPVAGLLLCRDAATGKRLWERAVPNSLVSRPAFDRYQVYAGCRDGNCYALDRGTGEIVWSKSLQGPILAGLVVNQNVQTRTGEAVYALGSGGQLEALAPTDGSLFWAIGFRDLIGVPYVNSVSTPVVVREPGEGKPAQRIYVGLGFGPAKSATPTARLYCFRSTSE
ncbi:MAG TPA: PQQ-binding-like beta-propeller repeat protein [Gemmataceae bacterium]|jgi:outer membrane protein assembly factor BamB|nr:PQQ-binding-like beta-propeller repeat protein [Gemmataceae bacterium]